MATDVYLLLDELLHDISDLAGIRKLDVGAALGLTDQQVSPSKLKHRSNQLIILELIRKRNLPQLSVALGLDLDRFHLLAKRVAKFWSDYSEYEIAEPPPDIKDVLDIGWIGNEQFLNWEWDTAVPYLMTAWKFLKHHEPETDREFVITMAVGSHLASWFIHHARINEPIEIIRSLLCVDQSYKFQSRAIRQARARLRSEQAMIERHLGTICPLNAIRLNQEAFELLNEIEQPPTRAIAALRDQSKLYVNLMLHWPKYNFSFDCQNMAMGVLTGAEALAGGATPEENLRESWLLTRCFMIECSIALQDDSTALRLWEGTFKPSWVSTYLTDYSNTALQAKVNYTAVATAIAQGTLEDLEEAAVNYRNAPVNTAFQDRINRITRVGQFARMGNESSARQEFIR